MAADGAGGPGFRGPVSLWGNYEYLTEGYYRCQDAEIAGRAVIPTCAEALDAYVVPVALEKAALAGIPVPQWFFSNEYFPPPAVVYGVNPFSRKFAVVRTEAERETAARQLTWNFKFAMCCQRIAPETQLLELRTVGPRTARPDLLDVAARLYEVFRLPLATVRLLRTGNRVELSAIEMLPHRSLTRTERQWADEAFGATLG